MSMYLLYFILNVNCSNHGTREEIIETIEKEINLIDSLKIDVIKNYEILNSIDKKTFNVNIENKNSHYPIVKKCLENNNKICLEARHSYSNEKLILFDMLETGDEIISFEILEVRRLFEKDVFSRINKTHNTSKNERLGIFIQNLNNAYLVIVIKSKVIEIYIDRSSLYNSFKLNSTKSSFTLLYQYKINQLNEIHSKDNDYSIILSSIKFINK